MFVCVLTCLDQDRDTQVFVIGIYINSNDLRKGFKDHFSDYLDALGILDQWSDEEIRSVIMEFIPNEVQVPDHENKLGEYERIGEYEAPFHRKYQYHVGQISE